MLYQCGRWAFVIAGCIALGSCVHSTAALPPAVSTAALRGAAPPDDRVSVRFLHSFGGNGDGAYPSSLILVKGTFYGTTSGGGDVAKDGTIFTMDHNGTEKVIYSFDGSDGSYPGGLLDVGGVFYGTTAAGGRFGNGTVYSWAHGVEKVIHAFRGGTDGALPAGLSDINGTLYGTATGQPSNDYGVVYRVNSKGVERVIYTFKGDMRFASPRGPLVSRNGLLYGVTTDGGKYGYGTIFSLTTNGTFRIVHSFRGGNGDGAYPFAGFSDINGTLYGTTIEGGAYNDGTLYRVTRTGTIRIVHSFAASEAAPGGGFALYKGSLYGVTVGSLGSNPYGTIFRIDPSGTEKTLFTFNSRGYSPEGLTLAGNVFYGVTLGGGRFTYGSAYSFTP